MERTRSTTTDPIEKSIGDTLAHVVRDTVRAELRAQLRSELGAELRKQRRPASLYAAAGAVALYAGAACALALGLVFAIGLPDWAAALIMGVLLAGAAYALNRAARPHAAGAARPPGAPHVSEREARAPEPAPAPDVPPVVPPGAAAGVPIPPVSPPPPEPPDETPPPAPGRS